MKRLWNTITNWLQSNLTISKLNVIKHAISDYPYDWADLMELEKAKLEEMHNYFSKSWHVDHKHDLRWIKICIDLLDIIINEPEDHPYVNTQNMWRFIRSTDYVKGVEKKDVEHYYKSYPQDLRWVKAEHLYYEIRKRYTSHWWD